MAEVHPGEKQAPTAAPAVMLPATTGAHRDSSGTLALEEERRLLEAVRRGEEAAFARLVERHAGELFRFACLYTADTALAEDAIQDAWLGFLRGLDRYEGRASLRTWLCRILLNRLRTRLKREGYLIPFSTLFDESTVPPEPAVAPDRFLGADHPRWPHHWKTPPEAWSDSPEERLLAEETRAVIDRAVAGLSAAQREVITLRDLEGWTSSEVCHVLGISESNQRVLLHRARSKVRGALERYLSWE